MFQQLFWHSWFRVHWKHCSSNYNTSRDLEVQKTCIKIGNHKCYKCKEKAIWRGNIIVQRIPLTQVQMLKSFNSMLIKFNVSTQETSCTNFFSSPLYVCEFFWTIALCREVFLTHRHLQDIFFKITQPPHPKKLNGWPLTCLLSVWCLAVLNWLTAGQQYNIHVLLSIACLRRSDSGARAKNKASERAGKNEERLGKKTRERLWN